MTKGEGETFREWVLGREGFTKVVRPSVKRDPHNQSRRRTFFEYRLSGTEGR